MSWRDNDFVKLYRPTRGFGEKRVANYVIYGKTRQKGVTLVKKQNKKNGKWYS